MNPINRYLINSPMRPDLKKNADGSLTRYIQKDSPGKDQEATGFCLGEVSHLINSRHASRILGVGREFRSDANASSNIKLQGGQT